MTQTKQTSTRRIAKILCVLAAVVCAAGGSWYWTVGRHQETTDDAYVSGNVVSVMSQVSGRVEKVLVKDHQYVKAGERLIVIDPTDAQLTLDAALSALGIAVRETAQLTHRLAEVRARIRSEKINLKQKKDDYERRRALFNNRAVSREEYQHARDACESAEHYLEALRAQEAELIISVGTTPIARHPNVLAAAERVREAALELSRTEIRAPVSGRISKRNVQAGQVVSVSRALIGIAAVDELWVDANFKELQLERIRVGQQAEVTVDVYGGKRVYKGRVAGVSAGTGSAFSLLPAQNATGNWIKIVQRVPVKILLEGKTDDEEAPLLIGLSAYVKVNLKSPAEPVTEPLPKAFTNAFEPTDFSEINRVIDGVITENSMNVDGKKVKS